MESGQCVNGVGAVRSRGSAESGQCVNGVGAVWSRGSAESGQCGVGAVRSRGSAWMESGQCGVGAVRSRGSAESGQCVNGVGAVCEWSRGSVWMESGQCGVGAVCEWSRGSTHWKAMAPASRVQRAGLCSFSFLQSCLAWLWYFCKSRPDWKQIHVRSYNVFCTITTQQQNKRAITVSVNNSLD